MNRNKKGLTRKSVIMNILIVCVIGIFVGSMINSMLRNYMMMSNSNVTICIILFTIFLGIVWLPLTISSIECTTIDENGIRILPKYGHFKMIGILYYVLLHNTMKSFQRVIPFTDIKSCEFTFSRKWGAYAYSRYTMILKIHLENENINLYINGMDNGILLPSGQGGMALLYFKTHEEIINMIQYFITAGVEVADPYNLIEALKDPKIVMYDYMESFNKKILF